MIWQVMGMAGFGEILAELRKDRGMTQKALAERLHVSVGTISNYENGAHMPDVEKLTELADLFKVTTDYLLGRAVYNVSPDVFRAAALNGKPTYEVIMQMRSLTERQQRALDVILDDMQFRAEVQRRS